MNRFVIADGLPYLFADGKTYTVRWDASGFTVGAEVKLASVPDRTFSEISIKAKCAGCLDSISAEQKAVDIDSMTVAELKEYAAANGVDIGEAKKKDDILAVIKAFSAGDAE